jgi:UDP-galactopyranose mutase
VYHNRVGHVLIVGAGFSGAVHARSLAEAGISVDVIDRRSHVAGNAHDAVNGDGVLVHTYGPHLFHTANQSVIDWVTARGRWQRFTHSVKAQLPDGRLVPLPINLDTVNAVFGTRFEEPQEVEDHLARVALQKDTISNAADYLYSRIGRDLTDLFFRPYTKKMWGFDLEDMSPAVVKRIPLRTNRAHTYFPDNDVQMMPVGGYTAFFEALLDHPLIRVTLDTAFDFGMLAGVRHCFASLAIDEFYDFQEGELAYRSLRFHHASRPSADLPAAWRDSDAHAVMNFTDDGPFTRETAWHRLPDHLVRDTGQRTFTREEPCDYRENNLERYYPVRTADGSNDAVYERYVTLSRADAAKVTFIGRCGTYRYLDMDQVVNQSLASARNWLAQHGYQAA